MRSRSREKTLITRTGAPPTTAHGAGRGERDGQPDGREREVHQPDPGTSPASSRGRSSSHALPQEIREEVAGELRGERQRHRPGWRAGITGRGRARGRPEREPAVAGHDEQAARCEPPGQDSGKHAQGPRHHDEQRRQLGRDGEQHRNKDDLDRDGDAAPDVEPDLGGSGSAGNVCDCEPEVEVTGGWREHGERHRGEQEAAADGQLVRRSLEMSRCARRASDARTRSASITASAALPPLRVSAHRVPRGSTKTSSI